MVLQTTSLTNLDTTPPEKMAGTSGFEPEHAGVKVLCLTGLATSQYIIWWAEQDLNLQCILRHEFTVRLLQPICISTQNGAECKIRTYGPHNMSDRLATCWFKPLTQLSIGVVSGLRAQNPLRASRPFGHTTYMVWIKGFEPLAPWSQAKCSTKLSYIQKIMVGMARLELARDSSQRSLSPLRLPIPPHPYARHARSNLLITRQDTPCTTWYTS